MDILAFLKNILPSFTKKDLREKLRTISSKFSEILHPTADTVFEGLDERKAKSTFFKTFVRELVSDSAAAVRNAAGPYKLVFMTAMGNGQKLLELIEQYVDKNVPSTIHIEGVTYQTGSVLRLVELLDFFADYSMRNFNFICASESEIEAFDKPDINPSTPAELKYLLRHRADYFKVMSLLAKDGKRIMAMLDDLPEITLGDVDSTTTPALAGAQGDPLQLGIIPVVSSIFHRIGITLVNYELDRYDRALKDKRVIEMRLEALRNRRNGNPDAAIEAVIDGYDRELVVLRQKISDYEERAR
jgi:hypothetical protein